MNPLTWKEGNHISIYEKIVKENEKLKVQIDALSEKIKDLPEGKLICARNNNRYKWYQSDGKRKVYIPKKERQLAEQLAIKKYLTLQLEDLQNEKKAIACYLQQYKVDARQAEHFLTDNSEYQELLSPYFQPLSRELQDWEKAPYEHNSKFSEQLIHKTIDGKKVRSKAESMIAMFLHIKKIPYRYECALELGETTIFPDFTIRHPKTGEFFFWEHFGMMDNPGYCQSVTSKLQLYISHNIIPTIQLITTYENKENPLNLEMVEKIVEHYFL